MKKKFLILIIIMVFSLNFFGCTFKFNNYTINNFQVSKKKPNNSYYTMELSNKLSTTKNIKVVMLDTNLYKEINLSNEDINTVKSFIKSLQKSNFIESSKDIPKKPVYRLFLTLDNEKYIFNIYSEKYISIHPWDGNFSMDYIDSENIQPLYNLFGLCKYLLPK